MTRIQTSSTKADIMIVDDTLDNLRLLSKLLTDRGYKVRGVPHGLRALKAARLAPPDLVLLDIRMPEMDGYEVCKAFKADDRLKDIAVIFLSALDETVDKVKGFEVGGLDYITKPFHEREVLARVETHLSLRAMQQHVAEQNSRLQQEIVERQQIEKKLRESEIRAKALLNAIPDLMFRLNRQGIFLDYKAPTSDLYTQGEEMIIGKPCHELLPIELADVTRAYITKTLDSGEIQTFEYQLPLPGHEQRDYEARMAPSGLDEVTTIVRDITERKQMEDSIRHAQNAAEAASRAKSVFLANMSHELRTPLHGMLGFAQNLTHDNNLTDMQREAARVIHRNGEFLLTLINDILDFTKIEAKQFALHPAVFALPSMLLQLVDMFHLNAARKGLSLTYAFPDTLPQLVSGDQKRLRQVLLNLLGNAVKFTQQGSVNLEVTYVPEKPEIQESAQQSSPATFQFSIEDTGIGIAPEHRQSIFQPFQQADPYSYQEGSTGLGLAISKRLVEMMGGRLRVSSTEGQGSRFSFDITLSVIDASPREIPQVTHSDASGTLQADESLTAALLTLPADWLAELRQAAEEADIEVLLEAIEQLRGRDAALAEALGCLVDDFNYEKILQLIP